MTPHPFAALVYSVEDTLGLWHKARKSEQSNRSPFDAHREHFQNTALGQCDKDSYLPRLDAICRRLHEGCNLSPEIFRNHINTLESIYISLAHQPNIVEMFIEKPTEYYFVTTLIPLMSADIFIFKENADEKSIYHHLDRILRIENLVTGQEKKLQKTIAKRYIQDCIRKQFANNDNEIHNATPETLIPELLEYLNELPKKGNQTCVTLHQKLGEINNRLSKKRSEFSTLNIEPIISAYTAVIILQSIQKKTGLLGYFHCVYNSMVCKDNELFNSLRLNLFVTLSDNYHATDEHEEWELRSKNMTAELYLETKRERNINAITMDISNLWEINHYQDVLREFYPLKIEESYLSQMVSIPPQLNTPMIISDNRIHLKYIMEAREISVIVFEKERVSTISALHQNEQFIEKMFYERYDPLIESLNCIRCGHPDKALMAIEEAVTESHMMFGFIKYSLAVLTVGLLYKYKYKNIKNLSLMAQVNDIINHQGIIHISIITPAHVNPESNRAWLSVDEYLKCSIVKGDCTYNTIILQAIYTYNFTVARHTATDKLFSDKINPQIKRVKILDVNYSSPLIIHDFLEQFNTVSGKILSGLHSVSLDVSPEVFARDLFRKQIVTLRDLTGNLLHCIDGSSLGVCLLDHLTIIQFCSVPGDDVDNIVALGKNTKVVELLFRAYQYHSSGK